MKETGSRGSIADPVIGSSNCSCVKLDWDDMEYGDVKYWSFAVCGWFHLWGFMILLSSPDHYHSVFDRPVDWETNVRAMAWVTEQSGFPEGLVRYFCMQVIKGSSTLRMGPKGGKPAPRIVYRFGCQDYEIKNYLEFRGLARRIVREVVRSESL